ncbi:efflux RND transporter permease subunit, partial [Rubripirellula sp.]
MLALTFPADVNTFVVRGSPLVTIEDTSKVEVSTSLRMDQLYWILDQNERFSERREPNLNATHSDQAQLNYVLPQTEALIEYEISGRRGSIHRWQGNLMSYDGIGLDPKTRTVPVRVLVDHPTDFVDQNGNQNLTVGTPPLVRGMFVQVKLLIRPKTKLFVVPSKALQPGNRIYQFSPDESVLEPSNPEFGEPTQTQISESKPQTGQFKTNDWSPGRVSIRESVMWREEVGDIPGAERITYGSVGVGPGGKPIEFKLLAPGVNIDQLLAATEAIKDRLGEFAGVFDIADDNTPGKWEFQFRVKDRAVSTGVTPTDLGETVRNTYFGAEVMRLQRGRHEVKLMVRYPEKERGSLVDFREIRVRTNDGRERP